MKVNTVLWSNFVSGIHDSCLLLPNLFSFELEVEVDIYLIYFDLLFFELNNYFSKNSINVRLDLNWPSKLSINHKQWEKNMISELSLQVSC